MARKIPRRNRSTKYEPKKGKRSIKGKPGYVKVKRTIKTKSGSYEAYRWVKQSDVRKTDTVIKEGGTGKVIKQKEEGYDSVKKLNKEESDAQMEALYEKGGAGLNNVKAASHPTSIMANKEGIIKNVGEKGYKRILLNSYQAWSTKMRPSAYKNMLLDLETGSPKMTQTSMDKAFASALKKNAKNGKITVYRGVKNKPTSSNGESWTVDKNTAKTFSSKGYVMQTDVSVNKVYPLGYYRYGDSELEVFVPPTVTKSKWSYE